MRRLYFASGPATGFARFGAAKLARLDCLPNEPPCAVCGVHPLSVSLEPCAVRGRVLGRVFGPRLRDRAAHGLRIRFGEPSFLLRVLLRILRLPRPDRRVRAPLARLDCMAVWAEVEGFVTHRFAAFSALTIHAAIIPHIPRHHKCPRIRCSKGSSAPDPCLCSDPPRPVA